MRMVEVMATPAASESATGERRTDAASSSWSAASSALDGDVGHRRPLHERLGDARPERGEEQLSRRGSAIGASEHL